MQVQTAYFDGGQGDSFHNDILVALRRASRLADYDGCDTLWDLWLVHIEEQLGGMAAGQLEKYFNTRQVWRWFGPDPIIKSADTPCVAYTLFHSTDALIIIALGACYEYPQGGPDAWWQNVILPRLRKL